MSFIATAPPDQRETVEALCEQAHQHLAGGDRITALVLCHQALAMDADCLSAHLLLANIGLIGDNYRVLCENIHRHFRPRTYFEIGVDKGGTIRLPGSGTLVIGVDPAPLIDESTLPPNVRIFRETSDEFFAHRDLKALFVNTPLDLAFIDGMHLFEYVLRDFINLERNAAPETRILVHDCYPLNEITASRQQVTQFWTGDVWKLAVCLKKYRPDLAVHTLTAPPSGMAVIRRLDPDSTVLSAKYDAICSEFVPLPYSAIQFDKRDALNLVPGDWESVHQLLG